MQPLTTAPASGVAPWEEPLGERPPVSVARALGAVPVVDLLTRLAEARDEATLVRFVLGAALDVADGDAAAFVRGADQLVGVRGRGGADPTGLVLDGLDRGAAGRPGRRPAPEVCVERVPAPGAVGRLVVVVSRPGAVDPTTRSAVHALALALALGLRSLAARSRASAPGDPVVPDTLTGLPGRTELLRRIEEATARSGDAAGRIAVLFVDVDRFKTVNDSLGHDAGDELLRLVGERLRSCVRPSDTAAHLEGDEFAVLLAHEGDPEVVAIVAERILGALRQPYRLESVTSDTGDGREVHLDASVGIALGDRIIRSPEELLQNADLAMARAKVDGRGRFVFYQRGMQEAALTRLELEAGLRHALADGALGVHFQPIHRLSDGALVGVEALARWQHPVLGTVPPSVFVPIAEHTGLIVPIGSWVMTRACAQVAAWRGSGLSPGLRLSVNLSTRQLERPGLASEVAEVLAASGLPADALVLEITESVLLDDVRAASTQLQSLRDLGVRIAIDDFGTGYATLGYLQQLPADILKVDKSFVDDVSGGAAQAALAGAVVQLARSLGLRTTAEGIETAEQLEVLRRLGCDDGQGYLFSRPLPAAALERRLAEAPRD